MQGEERGITGTGQGVEVSGDDGRAEESAATRLNVATVVPDSLSEALHAELESGDCDGWAAKRMDQLEAMTILTPFESFAIALRECKTVGISESDVVDMARRVYRMVRDKEPQVRTTRNK